jgi:hypothetical protein
MRHPRRPHPLHTFLTLTILLTLCTAAQAEDIETDEKTRELRARDILLSELAELTVSKGSLRSHFHVTKKHGVEYNRSIHLGERRLHLKAYGPIWDKRPGLGVEVRGFSIADHDLTLRLYGNTKQQGLRIGLTF